MPATIVYIKEKEKKEKGEESEYKYE